jgi:UDP-glucose 4-epimerase
MKNEILLILGGVGYIGGLITMEFLIFYPNVIVVDILSFWHHDSLKDTTAILREGDVTNKSFLTSLLI